MNSQSDAVLQLFDKTGAYMRGHFRLTSGLHSPEYLQCAKVLQYPHYAELLGRALSEAVMWLSGRDKVDLVVAPAMGGLIIGHEVARSLDARFLFTERIDGKMILRRGFSVEPGEVAVIVEDVVTTGGSSREVLEVLREENVNVLAAGSIIDRSGGRADIGVKRIALAVLNVIVYAPEVCPMCNQGYPIVKPGSRQAQQPAT